MEVHLNIYLKKIYTDTFKLKANYYIVLLLIFCMMSSLSTYMLWAECFSWGNKKPQKNMSYLNKQEGQ